MRVQHSPTRLAVRSGPRRRYRSVAAALVSCLALASTVIVAPQAGAVAPPSVTILAPGDGSTVDLATPAIFTGTAIDDIDGDISPSITWTSDLDGALGAGDTISGTLLTAGTHTITASATDSDTNTGSATITVTAADLSAPVVGIAAPVNGLRTPDGLATTFTAASTDTVDGDLSASITWTSDLDGALGTGPSVVGTLTAGTHTITAVSTDAATNTGSAAITVEVVTTTDPVLTIAEPDDAVTVDIGSTTAFDGVALDITDGDLSTSITWTSDLDGTLGTGASISAALSTGTHTITAAATNAATNTGTAAITVTVADISAPTVAITAPADGTNVNLGDALTLTGTATDTIDGDLSASITWTSDLDGTLGTGASISATLTNGTHTITAAATDTATNTGTATITVTIADTDAPVVTITSPADGAAFVPGSVVAFSGAATDTIDGDLSASITWTSDLDGTLGTGASISATLTNGTHTITAAATDTATNTGTATITVTIADTDAPVVTITSPADGAAFVPGSVVAFSGAATDTIDGDLSASITWTSDLDGTLGTGASISATLTNGTHTITAAATDTATNTGTATITVTIADTDAPLVTITSPADGTTVNLGDALTLTGTATDTIDGDLSASITWTSDLDGTLATGETVGVFLTSIGTHTITAAATDTATNTGTAAITVTVADTGAPVVTIDAPADGIDVDPGDLVTFEGTAIDSVDGDISASITWTSSLDGGLGTGASIATSALSAGSHTIVASVSDTAGNPATASISLNVADVIAPVVTVQAPADGATVQPNVAISFIATAADNADGDLTAQIQWSSDLDGLLGTGGVVAAPLSAGTHTITATAIDLAGNTGTSILTLTVADTVAPNVAITNPADGATVAPGSTIQFAATALDVSDGNLSASIAWASDLDGALGTGASLDTTLSVGTHVVTASVSDAAGNPGSDTITLTIADIGQPTVTIASPADGVTVGPGTTTTFVGSAIDDVDGSLSGSMTWTSDLDGALGTGASVTAVLSAGTHTITASATDAATNSGTSSITVIVDDGVAPVVTIVTPSGGSVFTQGDDIRLSASAVDAIDGGLSGSIVWTSDLDGPLGTGASIVASTLSAGTHTITASATDLATNTGTDTVSISVVSAAEPVVTVFSPIDGSSRPAGATVTLAASAADVADGDLSSSIVWVSDLDGSLGTGAVLTTSTLSIGTHTITASATDTELNTGSSSVTLTVEDLTAPVVIISEPADGITIDPGQALQLTAVAVDDVDGDLSSSLNWFSDLQGNLAGGATISASLVIGTHVITASVADGSSNNGSATVTVIVADTEAPAISITAPVGGSTVTPITTVTFVGSSTDDIDGDLSAQITWTSDLDGSLGTGAQISTVLSVGLHTIQASVADAGGNTSTDSIVVNVADAGAPTVTIVSPGPNTNKEPGANVWLIATAVDDTDGDLAGQIAWASDIDGPLGTGGTVVVNTLSVGTHMLTASVTDAAANTGADAITITVSDLTAPNTRIVQPGDLQTSAPGVPVVFAGRAWDTVDGQLADTIDWSSDIDGALGTGRSITSASLSPGVHTISASATDAAGNEQIATITHTVADAVMPVVSILSPTDGDTVSFGATALFIGSAADAADGDLSDQIAWSSDVDGALGVGSTLSTTSLSIGSHTVTAAVTDSAINTGTATVLLTVADTGGPIVTIVSPIDGSSSGFGTELTLDATASDAVDGDVTASITWASDVQGALGAGTILIDSLTVGTHVLTATAVDAIGNPGAASVTVTVTDAVQEFAFNALPTQTAQVDDRVRSIAVAPPGSPAEGTVFFGGHFLNSQLPGAASTDPTSPQAYAAAIDIATGDLTGWSPQFDGRIWTMEFSADGTVLYVGGQFDNVDGIKNKKMAAFDVATGNLISAFDASFSQDVVDIAVHPDGTRLYVAGKFKWTKGINQEFFAAIDATTGALIQSFAPDVIQVAGPTPPRFDPEGASVELSADASTLYLGGHFGSVNGVNRNNMAAVDALTGTTTLAFNPSVFSPNPNNPNQKNIIYEIVVPPASSPLDGTIWFCGDFYSVGLAVSPNIVAVDGLTGAVPSTWTGGTDGGTPACMLDGDTLWLGGHFAYAGAADSFTNGEARNHIANVSAATGAALEYETFIDSPLGVHGMDIEDTSRGRNIWIGGDFDLIDGQRQAHIAVLEEVGTFPLRFSGDGSATGDNFDVVNVEVPEAGLLTIDLDWTNTSTEMWLFLVDPNGDTVLSQRDATKPKQATWVVTPGTWKIFVKHQIGDGPYEMTVDLNTEVDPPDYLFTGSGTAAGTSWFLHDFDVTAGDQITIDLDWTGGGQTNLFVYDETFALIDKDNTTVASPKSLTVVAGSSGTWSIGIKIKTGGGDYTAEINLGTPPAN